MVNFGWRHVYNVRMPRPNRHSCADILSARNMWHHFDVTVLLTIVFCLQCVCALALKDNSSSYEDLDYNILSPKASPGESSSASLKDFDVEFDVDYNSGSGDEVEDNMVEKTREKVIEKLSKLLGLPKKIRKSHQEESSHDTPQFMLSLYHSIADSDGITRGRHPYNASVVRSFNEKDTSRPLLFNFNITGLASDERVLEAELHLYRLRLPREKHHPSVLTSPHYLLHVFQVVKDKPLAVPDAHRLLSVQYVSAYGAGWLILNVKSALLGKIPDDSTNISFLVRATTLFGDDVEMTFARRGEHNSRQQPILVLFNADDKKRIDNSALQDNNPLSGYPRFFTRIEDDGTQVNEIMSPEEEIRRKHLHGWHTQHHHHHHHHHHHGGRQRSRRDSQEISVNDSTSDNNSTDTNLSECRRYPLAINFEDIGWNVIAPESYNAYHCKGACGFPLEAHLNPTNHAIMQSLALGYNLQSDVETPCCVPSKLLSLTILTQDDDNGIMLKIIDDMVAGSCACH